MYNICRALSRQSSGCIWQNSSIYGGQRRHHDDDDDLHPLRHSSIHDGHYCERLNVYRHILADDSVPGFSHLRSRAD